MRCANPVENAPATAKVLMAASPRHSRKAPSHRLILMEACNLATNHHFRSFLMPLRLTQAWHPQRRPLRRRHALEVRCSASVSTIHTYRCTRLPPRPAGAPAEGKTRALTGDTSHDSGREKRNRPAIASLEKLGAQTDQHRRSPRQD